MAAVQTLALAMEAAAQTAQPECFELQDMHQDCTLKTQPDQGLQEEDTSIGSEPDSMESSQNSQMSFADEQQELRRSWANMALVRAHVVSMLEKLESGGPQAFRLDDDDPDDSDRSVFSTWSSEPHCLPEDYDSLSSVSARTWVDEEDPWEMDWADLSQPAPIDETTGTADGHVAVDGEDPSSNAKKEKVQAACVRVMSVSYPGSCWK
jgi:hypothetical protein